MYTAVLLEFHFLILNKKLQSKIPPKYSHVKSPWRTNREPEFAELKFKATRSSTIWGAKASV